jgi:MOSC domain-containing protein YiiM
MTPADPAAARLISVNLGIARPLLASGRRVLSAIGKQPVAGPVAVARLGLAGDEQADLSVHGGLDKAVYAYPAEHLAFWQAQAAGAASASGTRRCRPALWART